MTRVHELIGAGPTLSFELWPPRNREAFDAALAELSVLEPDFVSVTYGAGGSTRDRTHDLVLRLDAECRFPAVAHLCCAGHERDELVELVERYHRRGVENLLALRGDPPLDEPERPLEGDLRYASELVSLIRETGEFSVGVALHPEGHPESDGDLAADLDHAAAKLAAADYGITQFFFRADDYLSLVDGLAARGVEKPVLPGIMPVDRLGQVTRMAEMSGTRFPPDLARRLQEADDAGGVDEVRRVGIEVATELGAKLLAEGVPGLHFYTMNRSHSTLAVCRNLGMGPERRRRPDATT